MAIARVSVGKEDSPSLVSIDSQSQSAEPGVKERGIDGSKKINGRKRHIVVDTLGYVVLCICTAANIADSIPGKKLVEVLDKNIRYPRLKK